MVTRQSSFPQLFRGFRTLPCQTETPTETKARAPTRPPYARRTPGRWGTRLLGIFGRSALLLLLIGGCRGQSPSDLPNDKVWISPHFAYHARVEDAAICGDLLATLERHFYHLQSLLGFEWPPGRTINYYKFVDVSDFVENSPCPKASGGCTDGNGVYTYDAFEQHELVHAYLWHLGSPLTVVKEGAAVALACNQSIAESPTLSLADSVQVQQPLDDPRVYDTGGRLVRYLLDQYGPESFIRFYAAVGSPVTFSDFDHVAREMFGVSTEAIWSAALATHASCPPTFACSREALSGDGTALAVTPVCGLQSDNRTFAITAGGDVAIAAPASTRIGSCDSIPFAQTLASTYLGGASQVGLLQLAAGRYYLDFPSAATGDLAVLEPNQPWAGNDCSALQPFVVEGDQYETIAIAVPQGTSSWAIKLRFVDHQRLTISRTSSSPPSLKLFACPGCDAVQGLCQALDLADTPVDVDWQGDYVLQLDSLSPQHAERIQIARR